jgi:uncharacterized Rmd1/YagE family protein
VALVHVDAYAFSDTFKLRELVPLFTRHGAIDPKIKDRLVAPMGDGAWALAYDFGSIVFVGVPAAQQVPLVTAIASLLKDEPRPPLTEHFLVETGAPLQVQFDRVIVPELGLEIVDIVALIIAQSVAMDYYALDVDKIDEETERIAKQLHSEGRIPGRVKKLVQFIGECMETRNEIISTLALFDKPDVTWEKESLDKLWNDLYRMLELDDRYKALEAKLRMYQDNLTVLVDLTRQRTTMTLEIVVVVLILLEIVVMVWQIVK